MNWQNKIAEQVGSIPRSGIREFFDLVTGRSDIISLGVGEPDFVTPWNIREAAIYSLEKGHTSYTSNYGLESLRRAIVKYVRGFFHVDYNPLNEVLVTVGVSEAIDLALRAVLNPGDEVLYHEPCYVSYAPSVRMAYGVATAVPTSKQDLFALNPAVLEAAITPRTKVLMLNFPTNPTGAVAPVETLQEIARICIKHDLIVLTDEIYSELRYDGKPHVLHCRPAGHEGAHAAAARRLQGLCDDGIPPRLRLRAGAPHLRHDENPPVLHALRAHHLAGSGH